MKIIKPTMAILAITQAILYGDIYDTARDLEKKYGEVVEVDGHTRIYHWKGYRVDCTMFQHDPKHLRALGMSPQEEPNCVSEKITRLDGQRLTMLDFRTVLPTSLYGGEWTQRGHNEWRTRFAEARTTLNEIVIKSAPRD